jgi:hypothetical protein
VNHPANQRERPRPSVDIATLRREDAEHDSRDCPHCSGVGLETIYHPRFDGSRTFTDKRPDGSTIERAAIVAAYCVCPIGDWMRYNQEKTCPEVFRRMPELHDVLTRRIGWLAKDPRSEPHIEPPEDMTKPVDWRALVKAFSGHAKAPEAKYTRRYPGPIPNDPILTPTHPREPGED